MDNLTHFELVNLHVFPFFQFTKTLKLSLLSGTSQPDFEKQLQDFSFKFGYGRTKFEDSNQEEREFATNSTSFYVCRLPIYICKANFVNVTF